MASCGLSFPNNLRSIQAEDNIRSDKGDKGDKGDMVEEINEEVKIPNFSEIVNLIYDKSIYRHRSLMNKQAGPSNQIIYVKGFRSEVYTNMLKFLRQLMIINADPDAMVDEFLFDEFDSENKIFESKTRNLVKNWIREQWISDQQVEGGKGTEKEMGDGKVEGREEEMEIDESVEENRSDERREKGGVCHVYLGLLEKGLSHEGLIGKYNIYF